MMKVLSIDNALVTSGWAIFENGNVVSHGTKTIKKTLPMEARLCLYQEWLSDMYHDYEFDFLVFEDCQQQTNVQTYHKLSMVKAAILMWCYYNETSFFILSPSEWRKLNGGGYGRKREEQKAASQEKAKEWYKIEASEDECDALNIGHAYYEHIKKEKSAF